MVRWGKKKILQKKTEKEQIFIRLANIRYFNGLFKINSFLYEKKKKDILTVFTWGSFLFPFHFPVCLFFHLSSVAGRATFWASSEGRSQVRDAFSLNLVRYI